MAALAQRNNPASNAGPFLTAPFPLPFNEAYDVARDGRVLVVNSMTESTAPVVLVTNWDAELKK